MSALRPLTSPVLELPGVRHGFFTREGGVSEGIYAGLNCGPGSDDDPEAVAENRRRVQAHLGAEALLSCWQVHGAEVVTIDQSSEFRVRSSADTPLPSSPRKRGEGFKESEHSSVSPLVREALMPIAEPVGEAGANANNHRPKADGMVTNVAGVALGILTADCGPVLLADGEAGVIGACHAGWKGAHGGIVEATVTAMEKLGARRERIGAALGPCIAQNSYEVGAEFRDTLLDARPEAAAHFLPGRPGHFQFDLKGFVGERLRESGVGRFDISPADTYAEEERFFSYRRTTHRGEADYGRQISTIALYCSAQKP